MLTLLGRHSTFQPATTKNEATVQTFAPMRQGVQSYKHEPGTSNLAGEHDAFAANADVWLERPSSQDAKGGGPPL